MRSLPFVLGLGVVRNCGSQVWLTSCGRRRPRPTINVQASAQPINSDDFRAVLLNSTLQHLLSTGVTFFALRRLVTVNSARRLALCRVIPFQFPLKPLNCGANLFSSNGLLI